MGCLFSSSNGAVELKEAETPEQAKILHKGQLQFVGEHSWVCLTAADLDRTGPVDKQDVDAIVAEKQAERAREERLAKSSNMQWMEPVVDPTFVPPPKRAPTTCCGIQRGDWIPAQVKFWIHIARLYGGKSPRVKEGTPRVSPPHLLPHEGLIVAQLRTGKPNGRGDNVGQTHFQVFDPHTFKGVTGDKIDASAEWNRTTVYEPPALMMNREPQSEADLVQEQWLTLEMYHVRFYRESSTMHLEVIEDRAGEATSMVAVEDTDELAEEEARIARKAAHDRGDSPEGLVPAEAAAAEGEALEEAEQLDNEPMVRQVKKAVLENFPDYQCLVHGDGLPERGLLAAEELRRRIAFSSGWEVELTPLPGLGIPLHEHMLKPVGTTEWEWHKLVHAEGRAGMAKSVMEDTTPEESQGHCQDDTQFALELCVSVQPKLLTREETGPMIPKRQARPPIADSGPKQSEEMRSGKLLFCTDVADCTPEDVVKQLSEKFGPMATNVNLQRSHRQGVELWASQHFYSFLVEARSIDDVPAMKAQMEQRDFIEGCRNNHVLYLHK